MTIARPLGFQVLAVPATQETTPRPGLLRRLFASLFESRERQAQRAVDEYFVRRGSRLTDSIEREIGERMLGQGNSWR
jgi:hypothetical protein